MTTDLIVRLFVAAVLGGIIGLEREYRAKEAGFRTHFLVALGSALFMELSQYGFTEALSFYSDNQNVRVDLSRVAAQVVSGIGFIGAGTIIFQKHVVKGLTTAAGVWVVSAIGMACGAGLHVLAATVTVLVLLGLEAMNFFLRRIGSRNITVHFSAVSEPEVRAVLKRLEQARLKIDSYKMMKRNSPDGESYEATIEMKITRNSYEKRLMGLMENFSGVTVEEIA